MPPECVEDPIDQIRIGLGNEQEEDGLLSAGCLRFLHSSEGVPPLHTVESTDRVNGILNAKSLADW